MKNEIMGAMNVNKNKEIKISYEVLKNRMKYEDIFYEVYLIPMLNDMGLEHRFQGEYIILKKKESDKV